MKPLAITAALSESDTVGRPFRAAAASASRVLGVESVGYASGTAPRFNGNPSSRSFTGGRYDYAYDGYNRLTKAAFAAADNSGARYNCSYGYDSNSNVTSLTRNGQVNIAGSERMYGLHDYFYYFYDGNRLTSLGGGAEGADYEGRTGLGANFNGAIEYDGRGNVIRDETRGIELIEYSLLNLPVRIRLSSGETVVNAYDGRGVKHSTALLDASGRTVTRRQYVGDAVIDDGVVTMQRFDGGYFDASGSPQYYLTDWQGSVTAVADGSGNISQSVSYYPDGEPWLEPSGDNRFLFAGKERLGIGGLSLYDFGPRLYNAAGCFWYQPDPAAASYPHISPYSYCAGNPVRYTDPTGMVIVCKGTDAEIQYTTELISELREHKIFDDVFSVIDASETEYTICWGYPTLPDGETPADACFDPNNNTITFSRELKKHKGATIMSVCEELYHVYQKTVPTPELTVNEEYEAKTFAVIENVLVGEGYIYESHGLGAIYDTINKSFLDETNTKFVYRSNFPKCYVDGGAKFLQHHINNTLPAYKVPILSMPSRLIDILSKH